MAFCCLPSTHRRFLLREDFVCLQKLFPLRVDRFIHGHFPQIKLQTDQLVKASLFKAWHYLPTFIIFSSMGSYVLGAVQSALKRQTVPRVRNVVSLYKKQIHSICSNFKYTGIHWKKAKAGIFESINFFSKAKRFYHREINRTWISYTHATKHFGSSANWLFYQTYLAENMHQKFLFTKTGISRKLPESKSVTCFIWNSLSQWWR